MEKLNHEVELSRGKLAYPDRREEEEERNQIEIDERPRILKRLKIGKRCKVLRGSSNLHRTVAGGREGSQEEIEI